MITLIYSVGSVTNFNQINILFKTEINKWRRNKKCLENKIKHVKDNFVQ
jgi:hypothetical protein